MPRNLRVNPILAAVAVSLVAVALQWLFYSARLSTMNGGPDFKRLIQVDYYPLLVNQALVCVIWVLTTSCKRTFDNAAAFSTSLGIALTVFLIRACWGLSYIIGTELAISSLDPLFILFQDAGLIWITFLLPLSLMSLLINRSVFNLEDLREQTATVEELED